MALQSLGFHAHCNGPCFNPSYTPSYKTCYEPWRALKEFTPTVRTVTIGMMAHDEHLHCSPLHPRSCPLPWLPPVSPAFLTSTMSHEGNKILERSSDRPNKTAPVHQGCRCIRDRRGNPKEVGGQCGLMLLSGPTVPADGHTVSNAPDLF